MPESKHHYHSVGNVSAQLYKEPYGVPLVIEMFTEGHLHGSYRGHIRALSLGEKEEFRSCMEAVRADRKLTSYMVNYVTGTNDKKEAVQHPLTANRFFHRGSAFETISPSEKIEDFIRAVGLTATSTPTYLFAAVIRTPRIDPVPEIMRLPEFGPQC